MSSVEYCQCEDCQAAETPCSFDCEECSGCSEAAEAAKDRAFDEACALGYR
jgi:hypothetical protein